MAHACPDRWLTPHRTGGSAASEYSMSSGYMKNSPKEMADMIFGLPRISRELKRLKPYGYQVKGVFSLIQSGNNTDSIVYTSQRFQPYAESFSDHYAFVGPSVFSKVPPQKEKERPLIYVSMGTVINDRPDFYRKCMLVYNYYWHI